MSARFSLRVRLSDGFEFSLNETFDKQWQAERAGANYIRDYSDSCGLGVRVEYVATIDAEMA